MSLASAIRKRAETYASAATVNFWCHVTEGSLATFGEGLVAGQLFAVLVTALGGTGATLGALTSIGSFTILAPLFLAPRLEAARRKKRLVLLLGLGQRMPNLLIVGVLALLAGARPILCLYAIAVVKLGGSICTALLVAPWQDLIAETVPIRRVGRLFGFRNFLASLLRLPAAAACGAIIAFVAFPGNYQLLYLLSFVVMMASLGIFALVDELPESAAPRPRQPAVRYFRDLLAAVRDDRNFRNYMFYMVFTKSPDPIVQFFAMAAMQLHRMQDASWVFLSGAATSLAAIGGNLLLPFLAERIGHKRMLAGAVCMQAAAMGLAAVAPTGRWLIAAFFILGLCAAAHSVAGLPFRMRVFPRGRRVGYMTLSSVAMAPLRILMPLGAGLVSEVFGFAPLFAATGVFLLCALVPLRKITPGAAPPDEQHADQG